MGHREHRAACKVRAKSPLQHRIRLQVDRRRGLVQHNHLGVDQQRSSEAQKLTLPHRQVLSTLRDLGIQSAPKSLVDVRLEPRLIQRIPQLGIAEFESRIKIEADGALEQRAVCSSHESACIIGIEKGEGGREGYLVG
jgi:hypothetical protein